MRSVQSPSHLPPHPPGRTPTYVSKKNDGPSFSRWENGIRKKLFISLSGWGVSEDGEGSPAGPGEGGRH
jgi:hypothetical protein